jgi:hypothetical protein
MRVLSPAWLQVGFKNQRQAGFKAFQRTGNIRCGCELASPGPNRIACASQVNLQPLQHQKYVFGDARKARGTAGVIEIHRFMRIARCVAYRNPIDALAQCTVIVLTAC